jgi:dihydroorotate dehydrogenase electron transfer subunit
MSDCSKTTSIIEIKKETDNYTTIFIENNLEKHIHLKQFNPGQFVMLWVPRVDEKPFGISYIDEKRIGITYEVKGRFTKKLSELKVGDLIGIRGPYGNGYPNIDENTVIVAGGCGIAPLAPLVEKHAKIKNVIIGGRSKEFTLFKNRFSGATFTTDDGTYGGKGFVTVPLKKLLDTENVTKVLCCGPEIMMQNVINLCNEYNVECFISIERYMKCGFGICGQCVCGDKVVCKEGPIFNAKDIKENEEFNKSARLKSGKKVELKEYYEYRTKPQS